MLFKSNNNMGALSYKILYHIPSAFVRTQEKYYEK